jgi:hypothetical protein
MATGDRETPRRVIDPFEAAREGAHVSLDVVERVAEELKQIVRPETSPAPPRERRPRAGTRRTRGGVAAQASVASEPKPSASSPGAEGLADILAEFLDRAGEVAQGLAGYLEREHGQAEAEACPRLELEGVAGAPAPGKFRFTNTGAAALRGVDLVATDLIAPSGRIGAERIHFDTEGVERLRPGGSITLEVIVDVPDEALAGVYRGLVQAQSPPYASRSAGEGGPAGAWALLVLTVEATDPRSGAQGGEPRTTS